ncbi:LysM domain-containing protein [Rubritalea squalenifaciens DSM 18772]|uniref:LysM domain-containing protein n=1 Tax=Rubritalea squalenifaciens DSM 18772 TaxID=1123071 RepID=A0A1M6JFS7_9BACT|nr:LysM peptidoglycan-binding domain-containing protein [Rubritalea squalenifaciens]SHJ45525.1 LysM domain-containing protein [Rubritalea squalenifaciens DSM 18772]
MIPNARPITFWKRKRLCTLLAGITFPLVIASCSQSRPDVIDVVVTNPHAYQENFGPFDENGNYVESWADNPPKRRYISKEQHQREQAERSGKKQPQVAQRPSQQRPTQVATHTPPPKTQTYSKPKTVSKPKPKPVVVKPKKPSPRVHSVRKGDTLYALSRKYGTSVKAIQRANGISGSNIRIGQRLTIPR